LLSGKDESVPGAAGNILTVLHYKLLSGTTAKKFL